MNKYQMPKSRKKALSRLCGKTRVGTRPCSCTANLAHVHENWAKTWCAHVILAKKHSAGQHRVKRTYGQNGHRYPTLLMYSYPCSCTANLAHVHENWAKTWCAHVILAIKRSAGQHRVKQTFGQNGHRYPTLLMYS